MFSGNTYITWTPSQPQGNQKLSKGKLNLMDNEKFAGVSEG